MPISSSPHVNQLSEIVSAPHSNQLTVGLDRINISLLSRERIGGIMNSSDKQKATLVDNLICQNYSQKGIKI